MSTGRSLTPAEQYQIGIEYLEGKLKENPDDAALKGILSKLKKEKRKAENWRYLGTTWEHRI